MNRSGSIAVAIASAVVVVAGAATVTALALLPAQSSGPVANVASIVISEKPATTTPPTPVATPDDHGTAVPVTPAGPAVVEPEPGHGGDGGGGGDDGGGSSGKGKGGNG